MRIACLSKWEEVTKEIGERTWLQVMGTQRDFCCPSLPPLSLVLIAEHIYLPISRSDIIIEICSNFRQKITFLFLKEHI